MEESQNWLAAIGAASTVKLASSIDDIVWLAKFLAHPPTRVKNVTIYTIVCMIQTLFALGIASGGEEVIEQIARSVHANMSPDKILTILAGTLLSLYSIKLGYDYFTEEYSDKNDDMAYEGIEMTESEREEDRIINNSCADQENFELIDGNLIPALDLKRRRSSDVVVDGRVVFERDEGQPEDNLRNPSYEESPENQFRSLELEQVDDVVVGTKDEKEEIEESSSSRALAIVAFIGSLDDLTLFVPMLAGQAFGWIQLMIGAMLSVGVICTLCICITRCRLAAKWLQNIPLVVIVTGFALFLLVKGAIME